MIFNTRETYGLVAQLLHWLTALLILVMFPLGLFMHELPAGTADEATYKAWFYSLHKTIGVCVFVVALIRVTWAFVSPHPRPLNSDRKFETLAAQTVHWMLYGAIIVMPLTGWLHHAATEGFAPIWWPLSQDLPFVPKDPQLAKLFGTAHYFTAILLGLSIVLHIGGALKHVVVDHDDTLHRMLPGKYRAASKELPAPFFKRLPLFLAGLSFIALILATSASYLWNERTAEQRNLATTSAGAETGWLVDYGKSRINLEIVQSGKQVGGSFESWTAAIEFDPDNLADASASVEIDIASLSLGSVSEQALAPDFLNVGQFPHAQFVSSKFIQTGDGSYEAHGQLTIIGKSLPIVLPFQLKIEDEQAFVEGVARVKRLDYGIGAKGFSGDAMVGFEVIVEITLEATKVKPS